VAELEAKVEDLEAKVAAHVVLADDKDARIKALDLQLNQLGEFAGAAGVFCWWDAVEKKYKHPDEDGHPGHERECDKCDEVWECVVGGERCPSCNPTPASPVEEQEPPASDRAHSPQECGTCAQEFSWSDWHDKGTATRNWGPSDGGTGCRKCCPSDDESAAERDD